MQFKQENNLQKKNVSIFLRICWRSRLKLALENSERDRGGGDNFMIFFEEDGYHSWQQIKFWIAISELLFIYKLHIFDIVTKFSV